MTFFIIKPHEGIRAFTLSLINVLGGGEFGSGFASGVVSSLISSVIQARVEGKNFATNNPGAFKAIMIASGGLSGGFSSTIAGGKFVDGFRQGIITSGLNHVVHSVVLEVQFRKDFKSRFNKINPDSKPNLTQEGLVELRNDVDGLYKAWEDAGRPTEDFTLSGKDQGNTKSGGKHIYYNPKNILTNYQFAKVMFHEYRHCWQYITPTIVNGKQYESHVQAWEEIYGKGYMGEGGYWDAMEYDAYANQFRLGDSDTYTMNQLNKYYKRITNRWTQN